MKKDMQDSKFSGTRYQIPDTIHSGSRFHTQGVKFAGTRYQIPNTHTLRKQVSPAGHKILRYKISGT